MTPEFDYNEESPIAPIWIAFHGIPYEFYKIPCVMNMAMAVGTPLKVDAPTENGTRPSVARVCVAADITAELPTSVVIGKRSRGRGYEQKITYEHVPTYCYFCKTIGHNEASCRKKNPPAAPKLKNRQAAKPPVYTPTVAPSEAPPVHAIWKRVGPSNHANAGESSGIPPSDKPSIPVAAAELVELSPFTSHHRTHDNPIAESDVSIPELLLLEAPPPPLAPTTSQHQETPNDVPAQPPVITASPSPLPVHNMFSALQLSDDDLVSDSEVDELIDTSDPARIICDKSPSPPVSFHHGDPMDEEQAAFLSYTHSDGEEPPKIRRKPGRPPKKKVRSGHASDSEIRTKNTSSRPSARVAGLDSSSHNIF